MAHQVLFLRFSRGNVNGSIRHSHTYLLLTSKRQKHTIFLILFFSMLTTTLHSQSTILTLPLKNPCPILILFYLINQLHPINRINLRTLSPSMSLMTQPIQLVVFLMNLMALPIQVVQVALCLMTLSRQRQTVKVVTLVLLPVRNV